MPESKRLKLFVLSDGTYGDLGYEVTHSRGKELIRLGLLPTPDYSIQSFDLDLSLYENVTSVTVSRVYPNVLHVVLSPAGTSFEATSYNLDGTEFCKFDQNGHMELNEYDAAGRLTRVKDEHGNVIKEY